jgi:hypothetical protein
MTLRLGLAGHGRWGHNIERTLQSLGDVAVTILAKGEKPRAALDGVIVATQSAAHAEVALPYIEAGIATFIEKPMATTVGDARRIRDAAERHRTIVFVGHIYLYNPAFLRALELLPALGDVRYLLCEGMNNRPRIICRRALRSTGARPISSAPGTCPIARSPRPRTPSSISAMAPSSPR